MMEHGVEVCPLAHDYQVGMTDKLQHNAYWYLTTVCTLIPCSIYSCMLSIL